MVTVRFEVVSLRKTDVRTFCTGCGKKLRRSISAEQTINPWNKDDFGIPKTRLQISNECREELRKKEVDLREKGTLCRKCEE